MKQKLTFAKSLSGILPRHYMALVLGAVFMLLCAPNLVEAQPELKVSPA